MRAPSDVAPHHEAADPPVSWSPVAGDAVEAVVQVVVVTDGRVRIEDGALGVEGATRVRVLLVCETTFRGIGLVPDDDLDSAAARATARLCAAVRLDPDELLARHVADHAGLYDRFELERPAVGHGLATSDGPDTPARLAAARQTGAPMGFDPALAALIVHYGRY